MFWAARAPRWSLQCSARAAQNTSIHTFLNIMSILGCFLKQGICKYGYISTKAAFLLFKSEKGPFRNKKRVKLLRKELHEVLKSTVPAYTKKSLTGSNQENKDQVFIVKFTSTFWFQFFLPYSYRPVSRDNCIWVDSTQPVGIRLNMSLLYTKIQSL